MGDLLGVKIDLQLVGINLLLEDYEEHHQEDQEYE
jgi:hypothetical protein